MVLIAPSILSADFANLEQEIKKIENFVELLHIDVMDGHYVPNLTIGYPVIKTLREKTNLFFTTHLMISNPEDFILEYISAGSNRLVLHSETCKHLHRTLNKIKENNIKAGLALNPSQGIESLNLEYTGELIDCITIMTVNPGFPAQSFINSGLKKIKSLKLLLEKLNLKHIKIEVDGGINAETAKLCKEAGADILVAGNFIYKSKDISKAIEELK